METFAHPGRYELSFSVTGGDMRAAPLCMATLLGALLATPTDIPRAQSANELRPPSAFASIADRNARSRELFSEVAKVLTSPRCMNCHPAGDRPTQGNDLHPHEPPAWRAAGVCQTCHTSRNYTLMERASYRSIPGHPRWGGAHRNGLARKKRERDLPAAKRSAAKRRPKPGAPARAPRQ